MISYFLQKWKFFIDMRVNKRMKKTLFALICLSMASLGFVGGLYVAGHKITPTALLTQLKSSRHIPETADFGAYLAGVLARNNQDVEEAALYYQQAYLGDPTNPALVRETYFLNGLAGHFDIFMQTAQQMIDFKNSYYAPLFLAADAVKRGDYTAALKASPVFNSPDYVQGVLYAVIRAWSHAALGNKTRAFQALTPLKNKDETTGVYWYQRALIAIYLGQSQTAKYAFEQMVSMEIPTITSLMAARWFYLSINEWTDENAVKQKYEQTIQKNQATGELLITRADEFQGVSPTSGIADTFFLISTVLDNQKRSVETGLMFNRLALYLEPNSNVYKIWGGEQYESIEYYAQANRLYDLVNPPSDTILFKKAINLMLMKQMDEAEQILTRLSQRIPSHIMLATTLGNLYRDTNRPELAEQKYNWVLDHMPQNDKKEMAHIYFMRAIVQHNMGHTKDRDDSLLQALSLTPDNADILNYIGYVWLDEQKEMQQAMDYIVKAYQLSPKEPHIWDSLAWGYYKQGAYEKALGYAEKTADRMPYSALVQSHLGDIYRALGRKREAVYQYRKALNLKEDMTENLRLELKQKIEVR